MRAERVGKSPEAVITDLLAFAESIGARVVLPTPGFTRDLYAKTDVTRTWARFAANDYDDCKAWADGKGSQ